MSNYAGMPPGPILGQRKMFTNEAAEVAGIRPQTFRVYRIRGTAPEPDGWDGNHPWWYPATIDLWAATRRTRPLTR